MDPDIFVTAGVSVVTSFFGTYVAIRTKLAVVEQVAKDAKDSADKAHTRLDYHLGRERGR